MKIYLISFFLFLCCRLLLADYNQRKPRYWNGSGCDSFVLMPRPQNAQRPALNIERGSSSQRLRSQNRRVISQGQRIQRQMTEEEIQDIFALFELGSEDYALKNRIRQVLRRNSQVVHLIREFASHTSLYQTASHQEISLERLLLEYISHLGQNGQAHPFVKDTIHRWKRIRVNLTEATIRLSVLTEVQAESQEPGFDEALAFDSVLNRYHYQRNGDIFHIRHIHVLNSQAEHDE